MEAPGVKEQVLVWMLRIGAVITIAAFPAALLPAETMADWHARLGLGPFPDAPLTGYLTRSLSLLYGFHGVFTLIVSLGQGMARLVRTTTRGLHRASRYRDPRLRTGTAVQWPDIPWRVCLPGARTVPELGRWRPTSRLQPISPR